MAIADDQHPDTAGLDSPKLEVAPGPADQEPPVARENGPQDDKTEHSPSATAVQQEATLRDATDSSQPPAASAPEDDPLSDTSDESDLDNYLDMDADILRPLRLKGYSSQASRWSTKYKSADVPVFSLQLVTWNVDFMAPDTAGRIACILDHLQNVVLSSSPQPSCILLQELDAESFEEVLTNRWVREHFAITPPNTKRWPSSYGVATLVSRHARVRRTQMLQFARTTMGRTAVLVDVELQVPGSQQTRLVRIANTHLESLPVGERFRPQQLRAIAGLLAEKDVSGGGVVGGDMNIIAPADERIHLAAGLQDACEDPAAVTWGFQPPSRFPPGRLDRIFFVGGELVVGEVRVIGKGLKTNVGKWASDHYGLATTIELAPPRDARRDALREARNGSKMP